MKSVTWLACVLCMATGAACGAAGGGGGGGGGPDGGTPDAGQNLAAPMLIAGGGIGSGAINGKVNVYAIDSRSKAPLAGVAVRIGAASANMPLTGTTDTTGMCSFTDATLVGAQTITVSHAGHGAP